MSSGTPTYLPSPNWDIPATSDVVVLGRIIKDPKDPQSRVPGSGVLPVPSSAIYEGEKTDWETNLEKMRSGTIGLWAKCMQFISGGMSFSQLKSSLEDHKFAVLETSYILPDEVYLAQAVEDAGVQAYLQVHHWRKPVYMITGIKIAKGASVSTESRSAKSIEGEVKVDATTVGANVEAGPEAKWDSEKKRGISYGGSSDYIFAYQLTRMMPKQKGTRFKNHKFVTGALYGKDEETQSAEPKLQDLFDIGAETTGGFQDTWEQIGDHQV
ncbi:hypothetical protein BJ166DRAFT_542639 [Pestalotiopsis sp. NC0098]|nr:hypothetical protein BJ166DRAFT_542639 [Pestalotiopsis sp. NC0098]